MEPDLQQIVNRPGGFCRFFMKPDRQGKEANRLFRCVQVCGDRGRPGACSSRSELVAENGKSVMSTKNTSPARPYTDPSIGEYLRERLMPVEGSIPRLPGIEMYGDSIPAGTVGGDLFEYINFQQRYDLDARIQRP
jgi:hypothetical protein